MGDIDRRHFLQRAGVASAAAGGLWAAPSVLGTSSAWAFGSCPASISAFPTGSANTNSGGWARALTGTFSPGNPFSGGANGALGISDTAYLGLPVPLFLVEDDPTVLVGGLATVSYTTSVNLTNGLFYRFSFKAVCTAQNTGAQVLDVLVGGVVQMRFTTDNTSTFGSAGTRTLIPNGRPGAAVPAGTNPGINQAPGSYSFVYHHLGATGAVNFQYLFTLNTLRTGVATTASDDIGVSAPTIECSVTGT